MTVLYSCYFLRVQLLAGHLHWLLNYFQMSFHPGISLSKILETNSLRESGNDIVTFGVQCPQPPFLTKVAFSCDTSANSYHFYCLKASVASFLSFILCLYFKLNFLLRTSTDHRQEQLQDIIQSGNLGIIQSGPPEIVCLTSLLECLLPQLLPCLDISALLSYTLHQAQYPERLLDATGYSEAA